MSKHAPGPWEVLSPCTPDDRDWHHIRAEDGTIVSAVQHREDASLVASAPDLLEALSELLRVSRLASVYVCGEGSDEESSDLEAAIKQSATAIARATGATP